mgnify:CR=1 FL=1
MFRHQKENVQIIGQKSRVDCTDYRVLMYHHGILEIVDVVDTTDTGRDEVWVARRRIITKRVRHVFHALVDQRCYCNMTKRYLAHMGFKSKFYKTMILTMLFENGTFNPVAYSTWTRYISIPLTSKINLSCGRDYDSDIPF